MFSNVSTMDFTTIKQQNLNLDGFSSPDLSADPSTVKQTVSTHTGDQNTNVRVYTPESLSDLKEHMVAIAELNNPTETEIASLEAAYKEVTSLERNMNEVDGVAYPVYTSTTTNDD